MSRELRCALKPYLQKEMRNSKGIIKVKYSFCYKQILHFED